MSIEIVEEPVLKPSDTLISVGNIPSKNEREWLLDLCAQIIVDNKQYRFDQCLLFAMLIKIGLNTLGIDAWVHIGRASYFSNETGEKYFSWDHAWVQTEWDLIDGNIDSLFRNPKIVTHSSIEPYWGPLSELPKNRRYKDYGILDEYEDLAKDMNNELVLYTPILKKGMKLH